MVSAADVYIELAERLQNMGLLGGEYTVQEVLDALEKVHLVSNFDPE